MVPVQRRRRATLGTRVSLKLRVTLRSRVTLGSKVTLVSRVTFGSRVIDGYLGIEVTGVLVVVPDLGVVTEGKTEPSDPLFPLPISSSLRYQTGHQSRRSHVELQPLGRWKGTATSDYGESNVTDTANIYEAQVLARSWCDVSHDANYYISLDVNT